MRIVNYYKPLRTQLCFQTYFFCVEILQVSDL